MQARVSPTIDKKKQINIYIKQSSGVEERKNLISVFELICCVIVYFFYFLFHLNNLHFFFLFHICTILNHRLRVIPFLEVLEAIDNESGSKNFFLFINQKEKMKCLYIHLSFFFYFFFLFFHFFSSFSICKHSKQKCRNKYIFFSLIQIFSFFSFYFVVFFYFFFFVFEYSTLYFVHKHTLTFEFLFLKQQ